MQNDLDTVPVIGAEIFIEPGQTPEEIDGWFRIMKENGLQLTRIRLFENYIHQADGSWDFRLFDQAFRAGEKYGIKIYGNLFPATSFTDIGGFKFPKSDEHLQSIANYIKHLVSHFRQYDSLYGWVPVNEPGNGEVPQDVFSQQCLQDWKTRQELPDYNSNGYPHFDFAEQQFLVYYNTWFLQWLTQQIHQYDPGRPVHVNNHNIFLHAAEYDFPEWRSFLTSLGGSAHASWHFGYFSRRQYTLALNANSEMLRSGAGPIPWLMTELQGGNNTYSGQVPICPTKEEITQWIWTTIATGSRGAVFWCLNPRSSGIEAGEWGMVDFQDQPSDRLIAAATAAKLIREQAAFLQGASVVESGISLLYTRESMWVEKALQIPGTYYEGRAVGGVMKSALAYFEALTEMGLQCNFQEMGAYDFTAVDYTGKMIILAHQISIPSRYWDSLHRFVAGGGKLIVEGLTGYYDEHAYCLLRQFPFKSLFGGSIREFKLLNNLFNLHIAGQTLPAHLWRGSILPAGATITGTDGDEVVATRNQWGRGEVIWIPSLLGLGARINHDYTALTRLLALELRDIIASYPLSFCTPQPGMILKTLRSGRNCLSVFINKSDERRSVMLQIKQEKVIQGCMLTGQKTGRYEGDTIDIAPEETILLQWQEPSS